MDQVVATPIEQIPQVSPPSETTAILSMIERAARDPAVDIEKMRQLLEFRKEIKAEESERAFNTAMAAAQTEMRPVSRDASNPQTRSKYASHYALDQAIRPIYTKHGFSLSFDFGEGAPDNCVRVLCFVSCAGHTRTYHIDMPADGKGAKGGDVMTKTHATGSAVSYGRRYLLTMVFNIAIGDDDGNGAARTVAPQFISDKQAADLEQLIIDTGGDVSKFLAFARVEALGDIHASRYDAAVSAIKRAQTQRNAQRPANV